MAPELERREREAGGGDPPKVTQGRDRPRGSVSSPPSSVLAPFPWEGSRTAERAGGILRVERVGVGPPVLILSLVPGEEGVVVTGVTPRFLSRWTYCQTQGLRKIKKKNPRTELTSFSQALKPSLAVRNGRSHSVDD